MINELIKIFRDNFPFVVREEKTVKSILENKNNKIFEIIWDCVIVDEAHEGTTTALGDEVIKQIVKEEIGHTKF